MDKAVYDVMTVTMATIQAIKNLSKSQFLLI